MRNPVYPAAPMPLRILPLPWEDLASFLSRTARDMEYEQPKWLLQPENSSYHLSDMPFHGCVAKRTSCTWSTSCVWMRRRSTS
jgi:hypothetical protein